jgi:hypothetical protein
VQRRHTTSPTTPRPPKHERVHLGECRASHRSPGPPQRRWRPARRQCPDRTVARSRPPPAASAPASVGSAATRRRSRATVASTSCSGRCVPGTNLLGLTHLTLPCRPSSVHAGSDNVDPAHPGAASRSTPGGLGWVSRLTSALAYGPPPPTGQGRCASLRDGLRPPLTLEPLANLLQGASAGGACRGNRALWGGLQDPSVPAAGVPVLLGRLWVGMMVAMRGRLPQLGCARRRNGSRWTGWRSVGPPGRVIAEGSA